MKISVIIPTYKPQSYLWECLDSLIAQTLCKENFEVILVLNGCNEPYNTQIRKYISEHSDIQFVYIQTDQGGVSNARNIALDVAKGEYVSFIDDDDYVSPSYLEELYAKVSSDTISLCYPYAFRDGEPGVQLPYGMTNTYNKYSQFPKLSYTKARKYFSGPWMKLIPINYIQGRKFDVKYKNGEDMLFMFLISDRFSYVGFTSPNAIYFRRYRERSAATTPRPLNEIIKNALRIDWEYLRIYKKGGYNSSFLFTRLLGSFKTILNGMRGKLM